MKKLDISRPRSGYLRIAGGGAQRKRPVLIRQYVLSRVSGDTLPRSFAIVVPLGGTCV